MRLILLVLASFLLVACAQSGVQELAASLNASQLRVADLDAQVLSLRANLTDAQSQVMSCTTQQAKTASDLVDTQRQLAFEKLQAEKFQEFYEEEAQQNAGLNQSLQSCLRTLTPQAASTSGYTTIPYDDLMRNADLYTGRKVTYTGEVEQVTQRDEGTFVLRVDVTNKGYYWADTVWVEYVGQRVLENDLITLTGTFDGLTTYQAVLGNSITIPKITADAVTVSVKAGDRT